jgi:uncharacterized protein YegP (UPF0339 family)
MGVMFVFYNYFDSLITTPKKRILKQEMLLLIYTGKSAVI